MNTAWLNPIVKAVLYEGCVRDSYRSCASRNMGAQFTFGRVYPKAYSAFLHGAEPCSVQTECLQRCQTKGASVEIGVRFLHPLACEVGVLLSEWKEPAESSLPTYRVVEALEVCGKIHRTSHEAVEREITLAPLPLEAGRSPLIRPFQFRGSHHVEPIYDEAGKVVAVTAQRQEALEGVLELKVKSVAPDCFKIIVHVLNLTALSVAELANPQAVMMRTFASTHTILQAQGGQFVSLIDPPDELKQLVGDCRNIGTWPVLVGDERKAERDTVLSSPIILFDYPAIVLEGGPCGDAVDFMRAGRSGTIETVKPDAKENIQLDIVGKDDPGTDSGTMPQPGQRFFGGRGKVAPLEVLT